MVDDFAEVIAALNLVLDLAEDLPDLVFDGVRPGRALLEAVEVGKERLVDEVAEVIAPLERCCGRACHPCLSARPSFPSGRACRGYRCRSSLQRRLIGEVLLEAVEVFQEQQPGRLLGIVELGRASCLLPQDVVDVLEGLFKHGSTPTHHSVWSGFARANDGKAKSLGTVGLYPRRSTTFTDAMGTPRHDCWGNGWQRKQRLDTPTEA